MPSQGESPPHVVVLGASAGGLDPLRRLVAALPADLPAALFVVVHVPATAPSALARLLDRAGPLPAHPADDMAPIEPGTVTTARPDHHLLVKRSHVRVTRGPRENGHRPAIDPLFRSAARAHGPGVTAIVLSGTLDDGSAGATHVRRHGGRVLVQDPDEAAYHEMPDNVRAAVEVDGVLPVVDLARAIVDTSAVALPPFDGPDDSPDPVEDAEQPGAPAGTAHRDGLMSCPDCGGPMVEEPHDGEDAPPRYRCRVGHAWTLDSLLDEQHDDLERSLWAAVRVLEERVALLGRLGARARDRGHTRATERYADETAAVTAEAARLRELLRPGLRATAHDLTATED